MFNTEPTHSCAKVMQEDKTPWQCPEKPEKLKDAPIGQYHCPRCGMMVVAGCPHPNLVEYVASVSKLATELLGIEGPGWYATLPDLELIGPFKSKGEAVITWKKIARERFGWSGWKWKHINNNEQ